MTSLTLVVAYLAIGGFIGSFAMARERWLFSATLPDAIEIGIVCLILWPVLIVLTILDKLGRL